MVVYVLVTMDLEPVRQCPEWTGPHDWKESERSALAYASLASEYQFPVSCFAHPETVSVHRDMLLAWQVRGGTIGLHLHPQKFRFPTHLFELGAYPRDQQKAMVSAAQAEWQEGMGSLCQYFRPGAFSANDSTFGVLVELGFRGGAISIPERVWPQRYCVWSGAEMDPHRPHPAFRLVPGKLPFANVPLSVDRAAPRSIPGYRYCLDLRPTLTDPPVADILDGVLRGLASRRPAVPIIQVVAHNDQPFWDPDSASGRRMRELLESIDSSCEQRGMTPVGSGIEEVCDRVFEQPAAPPVGWARPNDVT